MKYPFVKCINPQRIKNPYTKEWITVPCGKCDICKHSKSMRNTLKCKLESLKHRYCMFVTLTYDEEHIPRVRLISHDESSDIYSAILINDRLFDGEILFDLVLDATAKLMLTDKFENDDFPVLYRRDAQLFIKRLRKHLSKYTYEKIRYYIVGEYGPKHYRPHYHALIWFDGEETFENFGKCLAASWKLGRFDYSIAGQQAFTYVAQYVNSCVKLPRIFTFDETEPFALHSFYLGEAVLAAKSKDIPKEEFGDFVRRSITINGPATKFTVWRSFESRFFPKCYRFSQLDESQRLKAYRAYEYAREWTGETALVKQTKNLMSDIEFNLYSFDNDFVSWLIDTYNVNKDTFKTEVSKTRLFRQIYLCLSVSKHFMFHVCKNLSLGEMKSKVQYITDYYVFKDMEFLKGQLATEREISNSSEVSNFNLTLCFDIIEPHALILQSEFQPFVLVNEKELYEESTLVKQFRAESLKICHNSIKHKTLNDLNNIFSNL